MIMEFIEGGSLRGYLDKKRTEITPTLMERSKTIFLDIGQQIAEGMKYLVSFDYSPFTIFLPLVYLVLSVIPIKWGIQETLTQILLRTRLWTPFFVKHLAVIGEGCIS